MRLQGRITDWRDEQGYGFIRSHDRGEQAFVHISSFSGNARRPVEGDLVSYVLVRDENGRRQARDVRLVADRRRRDRRRSEGRLQFVLFFGMALLLVVLTALEQLPVWVPGVYFILSVITYFAYSQDKTAARRGRWRTPESTLHVLALIGGWPGALLAQEWLRHKSKKREFRAVFWSTVIVNLLLLGGLLTDPGAAFVAGLLRSFS